MSNSSNSAHNIPVRVQYYNKRTDLPPNGYKFTPTPLTKYPNGCKIYNKRGRRNESDSEIYQGKPGLRFVRELEQGKETVRMDKVNAALAMFNMKAVPGRKDDE